MRSRGRKDIPPVEGGADRGQEVGRIGEVNGQRCRLLGQDDAEHAVVRGDVGRPLGHYGDRTPPAAYSRIDDDQVHGEAREIGRDRGEDEGSLPDSLGFDLVGYVHKGCLRADVQDDALHRADKAVLQTKVCAERDNWSRHTHPGNIVPQTLDSVKGAQATLTRRGRYSNLSAANRLVGIETLGCYAMTM